MNLETSKHTVIFQPSGKRGLVAHGCNLKDASNSLGVDIEGSCGHAGTCGKCRVRIAEGVFEKDGITSSGAHLSQVTSTEISFINPADLSRGYRLACQAEVEGDLVVFVPEESGLGKQLVRKAARDIKIELKPALKAYGVELTPPSLADHTADWERLAAALEKQYALKDLGIDYRTLLALPGVLREDAWSVTAYVWLEKEVVKVTPGKMARLYGLAVDIGTTTVAGYLCDLTNGELVATSSMMNPQVIYGEDVLSRISYTMTNADGLKTLNLSIIDGLNGLIKDMCDGAGIKPQEILDATVVGNTCMHHLFLGIDPRCLGKSPFISAIHHSIDVKSRDLGNGRGLNLAPGAYVHVLPIEAGFVGADNVGVLIAEEPHKQDRMKLIIDIGTNGELILGNRKSLMSCSCATGPALEGAQIKCGMRAAPGAVDRLVIDPVTNEVRFTVIGKTGWSDERGDLEAKGICGSAIIDVVPQLFLAGIIDKTGRFQSVDSPRLREADGQPEFVIAWDTEASTGQDIAVTQKDVRAIQLAKAAMYAGIKVMMGSMGVLKVDEVILAGAFGSYINKESAAQLGLFPDCDPKNIYSVGNAAGDGARMALLNMDKRREADEIIRSVEYLELTSAPEFERLFMQAMWLPHMKDIFPHLNSKQNSPLCASVLKSALPEERAGGTTGWRL